MLFWLGVLLFVLLIGVSIALHEMGHLLPAKRFGVKVPQYMIGFGPTLWSSRKGETEYGVKAIPVGGYIRMIGMYPPDDQGTLRASSTGRFAALVHDAHEQSAAEIGPGDENRVFYKLSTPKKIAVMLGGPTMNLLLAFVLFAVVLVGFGIPQPTTTVAEVIPCTPTLSNLGGNADASGRCVGSPASPAAIAGIRAGDVVTAVDGAVVTDWTALTGAIRGAGPGQTTFTVDRGGEALNLPVDVVVVQRPVVDADGQPTGETEERPFLGIAPQRELVRQPVSSVPAQMWDVTSRSVAALVTLPARLYDLAVTLVTNGDRDPNGPVSVVGVSRLGGEVVAAEEEPVASRAASVLMLAASLNLFLFLFNLLPILPLDGGHVAGALYEALRRRVARWRGKPDPGPVDLAKALPVTYGVAVLLIGMSVIVIWADLFKPISLG